MTNYDKQYIKDLAYAYLTFTMCIMILVSALCVIMPASAEASAFNQYTTEQTWE